MLPKADTLATSIAEICPDFASPIECHPKLYRRIDGLCNNVRFPNWGATRRQFQRYVRPRIGDFYRADTACGGLQHAYEGHGRLLFCDRETSVRFRRLTVMIVKTSQMLVLSCAIIHLNLQMVSVNVFFFLVHSLGRNCRGKRYGHIFLG